MKYPLIELREYEDRTEYRVNVKLKYPTALKRKNIYYIEYLSRYINHGNVISLDPFVWIAYKKPNILDRLFFGNYEHQVKKIMKQIQKESLDDGQPKAIIEKELCIKYR